MSSASQSELSASCEWGADTSWRQGAVLSNDALVSLGIVESLSERSLAIVITHDCDCVAEESKEPSVELLLGIEIDQIDGNLAYAKSTRKLHLKLKSGKLIELDAVKKLILPKAKLLGYEPEAGWEFSPEEKQILRTWLASRYARASFPDEFVRRMRPIQEALKASAKRHGKALEAIFISFDPEEELARDTNELYELYVTAVYDSEIPEAEQEALAFAEEVERAFEKHYKIVDVPGLGLQWSQIELMHCGVASDIEFTYKDVRTQYVYRFDDISLRGTPQGSIPPQA